MNYKTENKIYLLCAILLFPALFFPMSTDLAIFIIGGKTIAEGGRIYADFIDLKPPLIYYFFAVIYKIFGHNEITIRLFDYIYQFVTVILLYRITKRFSGSVSIASWAAIIYSLLYTSLNNSQTFQIESLSILPILIIVKLQMLHDKKIYHYVLQGMLTGILTGMKFTLGIIAAAIIADDLINKRYDFKRMINGWLAMGLILLIVLAASFLPVLNEASMKGFKNVMSFLSFYASLPHLDIDFIRKSIESNGIYFGDHYSIFLTVLAGLGIGKIFLLNRKSEKADGRDYYNFLFLLFIALFISVAVERKFAIYHYFRMSASLTVFSAIGMAGIYTALKKYYKDTSLSGKIIVYVSALMLFVISPVPRWINTARLPVTYAVSSESYNRLYERPVGSALNRMQFFDIKNFIDNNAKKDDLIIIMATGGNELNYFLKDYRNSAFSQSCFYFGTGAPQVWKNGILTELKKADWLIVQNNDIHPDINNHGFTSWQSLHQNKEMRDIVDKSFTEIYKTKNFYVLKRD